MRKRASHKRIRRNKALSDCARRIAGKRTDDMDHFFEILEDVVKTNGLKEALEVCNRSVKWTFHMQSPVTLSNDAPLSKGQRSDRNSVRVSVLVPIINVEYRMYLKDKPMFIVKKVHCRVGQDSDCSRHDHLKQTLSLPCFVVKISPTTKIKHEGSLTK